MHPAAIEDQRIAVFMIEIHDLSDDYNMITTIVNGVRVTGEMRDAIA